MSLKGGVRAPLAVDYAPEAAVQSFSTENEPVPAAVARRAEIGLRAQGGISGSPPRPLYVTYDAEGGAEVVLPSPSSGYAAVVPHGRGWVDGGTPPPRIIGTVFPQYRAGPNDSPANAEPHFYRRYPYFQTGFQPDSSSASYDPGWDRLPLPRLTRFTMRFTLRREFGQLVQRFNGLHTRVRTGPGRARKDAMVPPRAQRLTMRQVPVTYGSKTQVIGQ